MLALLLVACGGSPASASETAANPSTTPSPAEPSTGASGPDAATSEIAATGDPLPPGRYTRTGFDPPITIELDGTWEAVQLRNGFWDVQQRVGTPDVIAVQFANVLGVYGEPGIAVEAATHGDVLRILEGNPDLSVIESSESRIGGLTGTQVTVENAGSSHASIIEVRPGALGIDPERRLWMAVFDTDAGLIAIMVGGSVAEWQAALDAAEPVLESIRIGG